MFSPSTLELRVHAKLNSFIGGTISVFFLTWMVEIGPHIQAQSPPIHSTTNEPISITAAWVTALMEEARTNNLVHLAGNRRVNSSAAQNNSIRTWEDPFFSVGGVVSSASPATGQSMTVSGGPDLEEEGDLVYSLEQKLPLFGKAKRIRGIAEAEVKVIELERDYAFQLVRRELAQTLYELALLHESARLTQQELETIKQLRAVAVERFRSLASPPAETLQIEAEQFKKTAELEILKDSIPTIHRRLNRILNRPLDSSWPELSQPKLLGSIDASSRLIEFSKRHEPKLKVLKANLTKAEAQIKSVQRQRFPDVVAGIEGRQFSGDGGFREGMFSVGISLPWINHKKYSADLNREVEQLEAIKLEVQDYELAVQQELRRVLTLVAAARREALAYQDQVLPKYEAAYTTELAAWTSNQGSFSELMNLRRMSLETKKMLARAITEQHKMLAELITCCGLADFESLENITQTHLNP